MDTRMWRLSSLVWLAACAPPEPSPWDDDPSGSSSDNEPASSTGPAEAWCGDGVRSPGELCDPGIDALCTEACEAELNTTLWTIAFDDAVGVDLDDQGRVYALDASGSVERFTTAGDREGLVEVDGLAYDAWAGLRTTPDGSIAWIWGYAPETFNAALVRVDLTTLTASQPLELHGVGATVIEALTIASDGDAVAWVRDATGGYDTSALMRIDSVQGVEASIPDASWSWETGLYIGWQLEAMSGDSVVSQHEFWPPVPEDVFAPFPPDEVHLRWIEATTGLQVAPFELGSTPLFGCQGLGANAETFAVVCFDPGDGLEFVAELVWFDGPGNRRATVPLGAFDDSEWWGSAMLAPDDSVWIAGPGGRLEHIAPDGSRIEWQATPVDVELYNTRGRGNRFATWNYREITLFEM
jgi:hypothetical protein